LQATLSDYIAAAVFTAHSKPPIFSFNQYVQHLQPGGALMSLGFQKRSALKDLERIIPEAKPSGINEPWLSEAKRTESHSAERQG